MTDGMRQGGATLAANAKQAISDSRPRSCKLSGTTSHARWSVERPAYSEAATKADYGVTGDALQSDQGCRGVCRAI